jgi:hypothetical protein
MLHFPSVMKAVRMSGSSIKKATFEYWCRWQMLEHNFHTVKSALQVEHVNWVVGVHRQRWRLCVGCPGTGYLVVTLTGMQALFSRQPQGTQSAVSPASLQGNLGIIQSQTPRRSSQVSR